MDIVERLKAVPSGMVKAMYPPIPVPHELAWEAADEIERLRKEVDLVSPPPQSAWRPIEIAPKDQWVLVYERHWGLKVAKWFCEDQWRYANDTADGGYQCCHPTHWMPLPEPPEK